MKNIEPNTNQHFWVLSISFQFENCSMWTTDAEAGWNQFRQSALLHSLTHSQYPRSFPRYSVLMDAIAAVTTGGS